MVRTGPTSHQDVPYRLPGAFPEPRPPASRKRCTPSQDNLQAGGGSPSQEHWASQQAGQASCLCIPALSRIPCTPAGGFCHFLSQMQTRAHRSKRVGYMTSERPSFLEHQTVHLPSSPLSLADATLKLDVS